LFLGHKIVTRARPVKKPKMHQKVAAGRSPDPLGELKRSPDPLAAIWGLTCKGKWREGDGKKGEEKGGGRGKGEGRKGEKRKKVYIYIYREREGKEEGRKATFCSSLCCPQEILHTEELKN